MMRLLQVGDRCPDGHMMQAEDCPNTDPAIASLIVDDGGPDSGSVCGLTDGEAICCQPGAYTVCTDGLPYAVCIPHTTVVRQWPRIDRVHTVRPCGQTASWAVETSRINGRLVLGVTGRGSA